MTKEKINSINSPSQPKKKWKIAKAIWTSLLAALIAWWVISWTVWTIDIKKAEKRKKADTEVFWEFKVKSGKTVDIIIPNLDWWPDLDTIHESLDTLLEHNRNIVSIDATKLESIMLWEESLKTTKNWISKYDERLEWYGIDRNPYSKSLIWKFLGKIKEWSYWPYQVQPEAIDKYKKNPELYDELCRKIATFKLPNTDWEYVSLHSQLWLSENEMIEQIKNHQIYTFAWGERFLTAYWIVLIDQISRETESMIDSYDGENWYNRWIENTKSAEKQHPELITADDNIMSPYILLKKWNVSYNWMWDLFNDDAFRNGMISAYWCMDYINNVKNSNYLFVLSLLELNEWFKNHGEWDLNIITPTWNFWPTTLKLVNKHFGKDFQNAGDAKKFMDNLSEEELQKFKDEAIDNFEKNMRLLFTLNPDPNWINQSQSKYLSECLDITFNNMYSSVVVFSDFLNKNCWDKTDTISNLRNDFVKKQNQESLETIKSIMTDEKAFISFTWLDRNSYLKWIKYHLWPTLLASTNRVYQTCWIIPVIQQNPWWTKMSNEQNSISRFDIWVSQEKMAQMDRERWVEYVLQAWDTNIDSMKNIMRSKKAVREYLQTCKTINWDTISSPQDIPDELVNEMLRGSDGYYPLFKNGERFYGWDTIYIKHIWLNETYHIITFNKPATKTIQEKITKKQGKWKNAKNKTVLQNKTVKLCTINNDGTLTIQKWWSFQEILFFYSQSDPQVKKALESVAWKPITQQSDITWSVIKQVIRHSDWTVRTNIGAVNAWERFIIILPLN